MINCTRCYHRRGIRGDLQSALRFFDISKQHKIRTYIVSIFVLNIISCGRIFVKKHSLFLFSNFWALCIVSPMLLFVFAHILASKTNKPGFADQKCKRISIRLQRKEPKISRKRKCSFSKSIPSAYYFTYADISIVS